jgi:ABC-type glycerol-3-phosphate transport system substrate-binding protein
VAIIQAFQDIYPDIGFDVMYVPLDELRGMYESAVYWGGGPSVILGPAEWGAGMFDYEAVLDLSSFASEEFLGTINQAALGTCMYQDALICLPYALRGVLLYRNSIIIDGVASTYADMKFAAQAATKGGNVGAFLERGSYYSVGHLEGIGGSLMDESYAPAFNDESGEDWLDLLVSFDLLGATGFNTDQDVEMFKEGRIGYIIDGSWNRIPLEKAIGAENLAIDPWPTYKDGAFSGYVQADSIYLNPNLQGDVQYAALLFMGFLLDKDVQSLLAEFDFIPSVTSAQPRNEHIQQAMNAFKGGTTYPVVPDETILTVYWNGLEPAMLDVFIRNIHPSTALQNAYDDIVIRLQEIQGGQ